MGKKEERETVFSLSVVAALLRRPIVITGASVKRIKPLPHLLGAWVFILV